LSLDDDICVFRICDITKLCAIKQYYGHSNFDKVVNLMSLKLVMCNITSVSLKHYKGP